MSFYRNLLGAVAAIAIASPVFAQSTDMDPGDMNGAPAATGSAMVAPAATPAETVTPAAPVVSAETMKVNVNKATAKELMKVKGINASKARSLIACRKKHHSFGSVDEIAKCKGFTKMKSDDLKKIQDQLTVE